MKNSKKNLKWALIFLLLIIICSVIAFLHGNLEKGKTAQILRSGNVIRTIDLENVDSPYEFKVSSENGGYNIIRVEKGRIAVTEASCPDKVCVHQGFIDDGSVPIVCLPNKLSVVIISDNDLDAVTGGALR